MMGRTLKQRIGIGALALGLTLGSSGCASTIGNSNKSTFDGYTCSHYRVNEDRLFESFEDGKEIFRPGEEMLVIGSSENYKGSILMTQIFNPSGRRIFLGSAKMPSNKSLSAFYEIDTRKFFNEHGRGEYTIKWLMDGLEVDREQFTIR